MTRRNNSIKIPGGLDIKGLIEEGKATGKKFLEDKIKEYETTVDEYPQTIPLEHLNGSNTKIKQPETKMDEIQLVSDAINTKESLTLKNNEASQFNLKERQKTMEFTKFSYESYFAHYRPSVNDKRESTHIYSTNLEVLKKVCLMEKSKVVSLINVSTRGTPSYTSKFLSINCGNRYLS